MVKESMASKRWLIAQEYQLSYQRQKIGWLERWDENRHVYSHWAKEFKKALSPFRSLTSSTRVMEVGSGPMGLIFFLKNGKRFALDPLAHDLHECFHGIQGRGIRVIQGIGEYLPFSENSMDIVILHNTIDHTDAPLRVLKDIHRVLRDTGILYIGVNIYPLSLRMGSKLYEAISWISARSLGLLLPIPIFRAHPYMFSVGSIKRLIHEGGFTPLKERIVGAHEARRDFRRRRRGMLWRLISSIAYTGEFYQAFCKKKK